MSNRTFKARGLPVPQGRLSRIARLGAMTSGVLGGMAGEAARQVAGGRRPALDQLLMTPSNAARVTDHLSRMRGAAMKVGQLISMEGEDFLPPELSDILGKLREQSHFMPPRQLKRVLAAEWGSDFPKQFERFEVRPLAAASIGQVHRAVTRDGRDLAIKVQYPGVRQSIDSDVDNVAALFRMAGLVGRRLDVGPLMAEAKRQLREEADYRREGACLERFGALLADDDAFVLPRLHADLTTDSVLAMDFVESVSLDEMADAPQAERDAIVASLIRLMLRELFDFRLMQTDPNFANYRYERATGRIVLLDFGATREIDAGLSARYRRLLQAALSGERETLRAAALEIGFIDDSMAARDCGTILDMMDAAFEPFRLDAPYDFGTTDLTRRIRRMGVELGTDTEIEHIPPPETLFVQRKVGGMYLLAKRLRAKVNLRAVLEPFRA